MNLRSFLVAVFGALSQYYDHHLFGFLAASIAKTFTPSTDTPTALLNTYFLMAIAVCAKPVGALILGRIGDIYGRSATLQISLLGTSIASLIIAVTPSFDHLGIIAALILLIARMAVVALVSSGTDGVRIYVYEHIGKSNQCFGSAVVTASGLLGSFVASISAWFFTLNSMPSYSWRFAFLFGTFMGCLLFILSYKRKDSQSSLEIKENPQYESYRDLPTLNIIKKNIILFILSSALAGSIGAANHFCVLFFGTYVFALLKFIPHSDMQSNVSIGIVIYIFSAIIAGLIADKIGRYRLALLGFVALAILSIAMAASIKAHNMPIWLYLSMMISLPFLTIPSMAILKESIPITIRYRIFSLAHAVGSMCLSSTIPAISTFIFKFSEITWLPLLYFVIITITIISMAHILYHKYLGLIRVYVEVH